MVQLYIRDIEASITRRIKELKGFKKIWLEPAECKTVSFYLGEEEIGIWNNKMKFCVETGQIIIMVEGSLKRNIEAILPM